ncbi:homeotic protein caudal isoform X2 [Bradysia coprophila]|uniref:homeotic protein caudal isoform X2 n=1 Tax=Bradysia coprophila TaxID=38358 RepID=UPI00187DD8B0|nr:homeotic protein caudal isoform X2 [Bradysia coprophila]
MVSYFPPPTMYSKNHGSNLPYPAASWYSNYHPSNSQFISESEISHHQAAMYYSPHLFQSSPDWAHENFPGPQNGLPPPGSGVGLHHINQHHVHNSDHISEGLQNLPSPPVTVSGSEVSSPGITNESASPQTSLRPTSVKSPFEWMKKPSYQNQPNTGKTRTKDKYRVVYTDYQRLELEKEYHTSKYITIRRKSELAQSLQLSERQVKIWFQNRRAKDRKTVKKNGGDTSTMHPTSIGHNSPGLDIKPKLEGSLLHHPMGMGMGMGMGQLHHFASSHHFGPSSLPPPPSQHTMNQAHQVQ